MSSSLYTENCWMKRGSAASDCLLTIWPHTRHNPAAVVVQRALHRTVKVHRVLVGALNEWCFHHHCVSQRAHRKYIPLSPCSRLTSEVEKARMGREERADARKGAESALGFARRKTWREAAMVVRKAGGTGLYP